MNYTMVNNAINNERISTQLTVVQSKESELVSEHSPQTLIHCAISPPQSFQESRITYFLFVISCHMFPEIALHGILGTVMQSFGIYTSFQGNKSVSKFEIGPIPKNGNKDWFSASQRTAH